MVDRRLSKEDIDKALEKWYSVVVLSPGRSSRHLYSGDGGIDVTDNTKSNSCQFHLGKFLSMLIADGKFFKLI